MASHSMSTPKLKDFVFAEKLGRGAYASVYKACRKMGIREVVAIKCILKSGLTKTSTENLLTEIELLKKLKHENIVELKDFLWDDEYIYLIMEYCSGRDLSQFIQSKQALPEYIVKRFLQQMAKAMYFLWENNVAHMDLKPQNLLLTSYTNPILKIADFGFAKPIMEGAEMCSLRGSPLYMAPEIICKGSYDSRVDLWSIGVILYECLFGRAPFASKSFKELQEKICNPKPVELPYGVEVSDDCRDLLLSLLKRNPEERIKFPEFFCHPFVDLEHAPSADSMDKAIKHVTEAVKSDECGNIPEAVRQYCEALNHFVSAIHYERNQEKKSILRKKVHTYMKRAEELKLFLKPVSSPQKLVATHSIETKPLDKLLSLYQNHQAMHTALTQIRMAEREIDKEQYESALNHFEVGLGTVLRMSQYNLDISRTEAEVLLNFLLCMNILSEEAELKDEKKELLHQEMEKWMSRAEEIKKYLSVQILKTNDTSQQEKSSESYLCCTEHPKDLSGLTNHFLPVLSATAGFSYFNYIHLEESERLMRESTSCSLSA